MRKYVQLVAVLAVFFSLVLFRQLRDNTAAQKPVPAIESTRANPAATGLTEAGPVPVPTTTARAINGSGFDLAPTVPAEGTGSVPATPGSENKYPALTVTVPTATPVPSPTATAGPPAATTTVLKLTKKPTYFDNSTFLDGSFAGKAVYTRYGVMQVRIVIQDGRIIEVVPLEVPEATDTSVEMSRELVPAFVEEAVAIGDWNVDRVSGATITWKGFQKAMVYALRAAESK